MPAHRGSEQSFDAQVVVPDVVLEVTDVVLDVDPPPPMVLVDEVSLVLLVTLVVVLELVLEVLECVVEPPDPPALSGRSYV
jgi:hypothetical protein